MARSSGGGIDFWMELPVRTLALWAIELSEQLEEEREALEAEQERVRRQAHAH
jgi:hypothetical protein